MRDPWAIWVSEVMLQQTTVAVGRSRYGAFLERFPTVESMARASERDVLAAWSGLGYYSRARNLWRGAQAAVARGGIPRDAEGLSRLPGIGPYTAAAIASIAFGEPAAVVDGNVLRVLSRLLSRPWSGRSPEDVAEARRAAGALLDQRSPADHNQALMELGALVCTPRAPRCGECPGGRFCAARRLGSPEGFPVKPERRPARKVRLVGGVARRRGRFVLVPDEVFVPGHLVIPLFPLEGEDAAATLARLWPGRTGREVHALAPLGRLPHSVLDRRYDVALFSVTEGASSGAAVPVLLSPQELLAAPRGGFLEKALRRLATEAPTGRGRPAGARRRPPGG